MRSALALVFLVSLVVGQCPYDYNWLQHGNDWDLLGTLADGNFCAAGLQQSPIDITLNNVQLSGVPGLRQSGAALEDRELSYLSAADLTRSSNRTQNVMSKRQCTGGVPAEQAVVSVDGDGFDEILMIGGTVFEPWSLVSFEFHAPSEHTFSGLQFPMEVQYYFDSGYGQYAAVSYMFRISYISASFINTIAEAIRADADTAELSGRLPITQGNFFTYRGSWTTPPCEERVDWHVFQATIPITQEDLDTITGAMTAFNFRDTQDLNGRVIGLSDGCGLGSNHYAFNSRGRSCSRGRGHHARSLGANAWQRTPYAPHLRTQERVVNALLHHPALRQTGEVFADILDYNKRAVLDDTAVESDYRYTRSFPEIKNPELKAHVEDLAGVFSRATYSMEGLDYQRYDEESAINRFHSQINATGVF